MKLSTQILHTNQIKCHESMQITLENDVNVPDTKPDIDFIIRQNGSLELTEIKSDTNKVHLRGFLPFILLYSSNDDIRPVHDMQGQISFEETMNLEGLTPSDEVFCHYDLEDCQIQLINSRKISVRAIVSFYCQAEEDSQSTVGVDILSDEAVRAGMEQTDVPEGLHKHFSPLSYTQSTPRRKDIFRIKDEITLPKGKPDMDYLLYYKMTPQNLQTRLVEDGVRITGDLQLFALYVPEDEERRMEYLETEISIDGIVSCPGCHEQMIPDVSFLPLNQELEIKADEDGERRLLDLEMSLSLNMKFYEDRALDILEDAYSTACELSLTTEQMAYEKLMIKTQNVLRASERIQIEKGKEKPLQICTADGRVQIDIQEIQENGIYLEGIISLDILYITENDQHPLENMTGIIPFQHFLEVKNMSPQDHYLLQTDISQISVLMLDAEEIEAKVVINLNAIVFSPSSQTVVTQIQESPLDLERLQKMPGIVGFIAGENSTLWDIAKEYATSPESIMELNGLTSDQIHPGDRLILVKQVDG